MSPASLCEQILSVISEYECELSQFTQQVRACKGDSVHSNYHGLLPALDKVFASDKKLQDSLKQMDLQQDSLNRMARLEEQHHELEAQASSLKDEIFSAIYDMKLRIQHEQDRLALLKNIAQKGLDVDVVMASAQRLSLTEAPPSGWKPEHPLILHRPPYPTEDLMRASLLFRIMNVGEKEERGTPAQQYALLSEGQAASSPQAKPLPQGADDQSMLLDLDLNPDLI